MSRLVRFAVLILIIALAAACSPPVDPLPSGPAATALPPGSTPAVETSSEAAPTAAPPTAAMPTAAPPVAAVNPLTGSIDPVPGIELESISAGRLEQVQQAGAHWVRRNALSWAQVEPQEGARNWEAVAELEAELERAAAAGLQVILVVRGTPDWAQALPGVACGPALPEKLPVLAAFLHDAVARYSAAPYNVMYWELGNEPDIDPTLVPPDGPFGCQGEIGDPYYGGEAYAEVLKAAYPQIKAANPDAQVLIGGLLVDCDPLDTTTDRYCAPSRYIEGILLAGGGDFFDGVSFHAYDFYGGPGRYANGNWNSSSETTGPVVSAKAAYLRDRLAIHRHPEKYLINTEAGLLCGRDGSEPECITADFQHTKAAYVALSNAAAQAAGLRGNVWYSLSGWRGTALVASGGEPLPAYTAFQVSAEALDGAVFVRRIDEYAGVIGYEFSRDGGRVLLLASGDGAEHTLTLPAVPAAVMDVLGQPQPPSAELTVSLMPLWVEIVP